ncbi:MAG: TetR/AcrR family transcriptional regulator [Aquabacterium sp.]
MAKNKRNIDAQLKRDEIVTHALALFQAHGFEDTSMAMISRSAGIAANTIYWYFAGKDEVLLATLDRLVQSLVAEYQHKRFRSALQSLTWVMDQFSAYKPLIGAVHARLEQSPAIREWHERYHQALESFITAHLTQEGLSPERAQLMATVGTFVMEGLLSHPHSTAQRHAILSWLAGERGSGKTGSAGSIGAKSPLRSPT